MWRATYWVSVGRTPLEHHQIHWLFDEKSDMQIVGTAEDENTDNRSSDHESERGLEDAEAREGDPDLDPNNRLDTANWGVRWKCRACTHAQSKSLSATRNSAGCHAVRPTVLLFHSVNPQVLSPSMLLTQKTPVPVSLDCSDSKDLYRAQWKRVQALSNIFWKRWSSDYLASLQGRRKWTDPQRNIKAGDVVLLRDKDLSCNDWPIGVVCKAIPTPQCRWTCPQSRTAGLAKQKTSGLPPSHYRSDRAYWKLTVIVNRPSLTIGLPLLLHYSSCTFYCRTVC